MMNHNLPRVLLEKLSFFKSTDHGAINFDAKTVDSGNSQIEKCRHQNHNLFKKPVSDLIFQLIVSIIRFVFTKINLCIFFFVVEKYSR